MRVTDLYIESKRSGKVLHAGRGVLGATRAGAGVGGNERPFVAFVLHGRRGGIELVRETEGEHGLGKLTV